jgi:hypothetical protein
MKGINMENNIRIELTAILSKFAGSGWELIEEVSKNWLSGKCNTQRLIAAIEQADLECGNCGCEFDPLYKRVLELKEYL